jgi:hypothetical protein
MGGLFASQVERQGIWVVILTLCRSGPRPEGQGKSMASQLKQAGAVWAEINFEWKGRFLLPHQKSLRSHR